MRLERGLALLPHDVLDRHATRNERIRQQHPVTSPPDGLRAHHRNAPLLTEQQKVLDARCELLSCHVVRIAAERLVPPCAVLRVARWFSQSTQLCEVPILDAFACKTGVERLAAEMRVPPGSRNRPHVRQTADGMRSEQLEKLLSAARRVPYRPDSRGRHTRACLQPACRKTWLSPR